MQHPFLALSSEYTRDLATMVITDKTRIEAGVHEIVRSGLDDYKQLAAAFQNKVPAAFLGALDLREGDCNRHLGIGQGDPWDRVSTHVPRGMGPWTSWLKANIFYVHYDHLDDLSAPSYTMPYACWKGEAWNGFGPRNHGRKTGYLWGGTNIYTGGKYVADGVWKSDAHDTQPGIIPVILTLVNAYPELAFDQLPTLQDAPPTAPIAAPAGLGGGNESTTALQDALNKLLNLNPPLELDGSYGRMTRNAVRDFQRAHGLQVDGVAGPKTLAAVHASLAGLGASLLATLKTHVSEGA